MASEETLKLLWDCANALDAESHTKKLLKSYYINTCRKIARNIVQVPKEKFAVSQMCPRCSAFWSESEFRLKLKPQHVAKSGKAQKLIAKLEEATSTQTKGLLSKKQRRRAKWLKKRVCSNVEIFCENCKQKSLIPLQKPNKKLKAAEAEETLVEEPIITSKSKKKKNKKKDQMAGLKIVAKTKQELPMPKTNSAKIAKMKQTSSDDLTHSISKASNPFATATMPKSGTKASPNLNQSLKAKKRKKSKSKATPAAPVTPTVQSKTQQKNSLLQLAALLKKQGTKSNTAQNRLETLLK